MNFKRAQKLHMDDEARLKWAESRYPCTILKDRYHGLYSGDDWLAFPLQLSDVPEEVLGDDTEAAEFFWSDNAEDAIFPIGRGQSPQAALDDLIQECRLGTYDESALPRPKLELKDVLGSVPHPVHTWRNKRRAALGVESQKFPIGEVDEAGRVTEDSARRHGLSDSSPDNDANLG